jgi:uncharacterized membrane protein YqjE
MSDRGTHQNPAAVPRPQRDPAGDRVRTGDITVGSEPAPSLGELIGELTSEFGSLVTAHIDLAKVELKQDVRDAGRAGGMFGAAGVSALIALIMLSSAAAWGLAEVMAPGFAFLIVGAVWAVAAGVMAMMGRKRVDAMSMTPEETVDELKEDKRWIRSETR